MITLTGYTDRLSAAPGERIAFKVSSTAAGPYRASLARVVHADPNPAGPGVKMEDLTHRFAIERPSRRQPLPLGSFAYVDAAATLRLAGPLTVVALVWPTLARGEQCVLSRWSEAGGAGWALSLGPGGVTARVGGVGGASLALSTGAPLSLRQWHRIWLVADPTTGTLRVGHAGLGGGPGAPRGEASVPLPPGARLEAAVPMLIGARLAPDACEHFNGKIEDPMLLAVAAAPETLALDPLLPPTGLVAAWDFSQGIDGLDVVDVGPHRLGGRLVNLPTRAVTGARWTGREMCWRHAPREYAAVHFHEDDLYDAGWATDFEFTVPEDLASGAYVMRLAAEGHVDELPFYVRPPRGRPSADVLFIASTYTYQAYANHARSSLDDAFRTRIAAWDAYPANADDHPEYGPSTYNRHHDGSGVCYSSRLRPMLTFRPRYLTFNDPRGSGLRHYPADTHLLDWLEVHGILYDVVTDEDVDAEGAALLAPYATVLTGSHPEYHTARTLDAHAGYLEGGGRLVYLGGNGFYWRIATSAAVPGVLEVRRAEGGIRTWDAQVGEYYHALDGAYGGLCRRNGRPPQRLVAVGFSAQGIFEGSHYRRQPGAADPRAAWILEGVKDEINENPPQAKFCLECGAGLAVICPNCRAELPPSAKFCLECGQRVTPPGAAMVSPSASRAAYTPPHLAERILTAKAALEGERKQVTVLFADLKGSMELLADRDPEDARKILDPVLAHMMDAVHRFEGTVNQVMGDGIMALFGAPNAHEDHAVRACYAALRMQESVNRYAAEAWHAHGVTVQIRVGLNSGEVVVRAIGNDLHMDYTAVGETTHLAARMEQAARPGTVLLAPATLHLAEGFVAVKALGPVPVKGRSEPVEVYELSGIGPARTRLQAAARRGLTRFVGRDAEIEMLRRSLERAGAGHGQVIAIVGEAGVGKSRLHWEFTRSLHADGWLVLRSRSASYGRGTPYLHVIELLKDYLGMQERDDARQVRERVADKLLSLDRTLEPLLTPLLGLLNVPVDDGAWDALDPPQRRQRILEAVKRLLLRESQVRPLLLVVADLHWIDSESQALLDALIESLPTARVLLVVDYRPEYQHAWASKSYYTQLRVDPLPSESAEELLTALLGQDESLEPLKRVLIERTEGNPFFLEESVQTLVETEVLIGVRGAYRMTEAPEAWQIPATAQAVLAARIDRLPPEDKRLLQAAAIIGKDVPVTLLKAIAEVPEDSVHRGLTRLQASEFLYETSVFPDLEYTFKHALTHEVTYASVLQDRRRALHAEIVGAIETLYPDRSDEQVERLGHHAFRDELSEKAVTYLRHAGAKAVTHSAYPEAVTRFEQALEALHPLPATRQKVESAIDLRLELRQALFPLNELATVWRYLQEAEELARTLDDPRRLGWVSAYMSGHHVHTGGHVNEVRSFAETVDAIAERLGDAPLQVAAQQYLAYASHLSGSYRATEHIYRRLIQSLPDHRTRERFGLTVFPAVMSRAHLARALAERGIFDEGDAYGQEAIRIAEALEHPFSIVVGCRDLAYLKSLRGQLSGATGLLERAVAQCRESNITNQTPIVMASLGHVYAWSGRIREGISCLQQALTDYESAGIGFHHSLSVEQLGEAYLLADQLDDARACADRAVMLARGRGERGHEAWALRLLGDVITHHARPDVATAAAHYDAALSLASELEMRPLVAHCHHGLGRLYRRTGNPGQAQKHLTAAAAMYGEMGMTYWLEKLEKQINPVA